MAENRQMSRVRNLFSRRKSLPSVLDVGVDAAAFGADGPAKVNDPYRAHAWVNIAISILIRNVA